MTPPNTLPLPWEKIDSVFLDMDGTLLDLHFDNVFFQETVPRAFAERHQLPLSLAKSQVLTSYKKSEGSLDWYDLDHWSRTLKLDVVALKRGSAHLIQIKPHVLPFLERLTHRKHPIHLVTNAHPEAVAIKFEQTGLKPWFTSVTSSHHLGHAKETAEFWHLLRGKIDHNPPSSLLAEDTEAILIVAQDQGIGHPIHISAPSSHQPPRPSQRFPSILDFRAIMPL